MRDDGRVGDGPVVRRGRKYCCDFAPAWQDSDKLVYSTTLTDPATLRASCRRLKAEAVRDLKQASSTDLLVGGPGLAAHAACRARRRDPIGALPVALGAGKPALPTDLRLDLELIDERRFGNGANYVAYRCRILASNALAVLTALVSSVRLQKEDNVAITSGFNHVATLTPDLDRFKTQAQPGVRCGDHVRDGRSWGYPRMAIVELGAGTCSTCSRPMRRA